MQKLLYTTRAELSLESFKDWEVQYYDTLDSTGSTHDRATDPDLVYFRDVFNDSSYIPDPDQINRLINQYRNAKIIDHLTNFDDMVRSEDKYCQSQTYGNLYPQTWLPSQREFIPGQHLAKPRISQRAKDILFGLGGRKLDDNWIIQELLDIKEELRVYAICSEIIQPASIKSSKSTGAVKVIGTRELTQPEQDFVQQALDKCPLDVVGLDLAILNNGSMKIIEANRSPQFRRYAERTGINLAERIEKTFSATDKTTPRERKLVDVI